VTIEKIGGATGRHLVVARPGRGGHPAGVHEARRHATTATPRRAPTPRHARADPTHREPIYTPGRKWSRSIRRCPKPPVSHAQCRASTSRKGGGTRASPSIPAHPFSGGWSIRSGGERRAPKWLAELQQRVREINPSDAPSAASRLGAWVWSYGAESQSKAKVKALVTDASARRNLDAFPSAAGPGRRPAQQISDGYDTIVAGRERRNTLTTSRLTITLYCDRHAGKQ